VFAITQVTTLLTEEPTRNGVLLHGMLVLAAVWWARTTYAWLTSAADVDEGGIRLAMLAAMAAMLGVALAVPGAFGGDAVLQTMPVDEVRPASGCGVAGGRLRNGLIGAPDRHEQEDEERRVEQCAT
jgi:hypothetical protein